ncbi:MAG: glutamate-1-semialdehyde 2,1-aminomutase [Phycisphaeraceae bacterium JB051]
MAKTPSPSRTKLSSEAFSQACKVMPGGVSSPVRAYKSVGCEPIFAKSGSGCTVTDIDDNSYVDYVGSYGPLILGHCPDPVVAAMTKAARKGSSFGMPTEAETKLANMVIDAIPSVEQVRFVNSGTEATMSAIRLARAATKKPAIIKCTGCYHGHSDGLLVEAGSGALTLGHPSSPGVPSAITDNTLLLPFNDLDAAKQLFEAKADQIAGIILEPIAGNMGTIPPAPGSQGTPGYLEGLRELCDKHNAILIFDEVMTGFRVHSGCAQSLYNITPDLTCLGKVIGGGMPCAAYGGKAELMQLMAPAGPVYQAGTLSGNPLAMAAGIATLTEVLDEKNEVYEHLEAMSARLQAGLEKVASEAGVPVTVQRVGSMITCFFTEQANTPVTCYADVAKCDTVKFAAFFRTMLDEGVLLPPSQFETWFVSFAHDEAAIDKTIAAAGKAFAAL